MICYLLFVMIGYLLLFVICYNCYSLFVFCYLLKITQQYLPHLCSVVREVVIIKFTSIYHIYLFCVLNLFFSGLFVCFSFVYLKMSQVVDRW